MGEGGGKRCGVNIQNAWHLIELTLDGTLGAKSLAAMRTKHGLNRVPFLLSIS